MSPEFHSWVPTPVRQACENVCRADSPWPESDRLAARRLVTDTRMKALYGSRTLKWASGHNSTTAWKLWFGAAHSAGDIDERRTRDAVKRQQSNVAKFAATVRQAVELLGDIEAEQESAPIDIPLHFVDTLHLIDRTVADREAVTDAERARYELYARPRLEEIFRFNSSAANFIPSVAQVLSALACDADGLAFALESRKTIPWSSHASSWLASQKESDGIGVYVRTFDRAMWDMRWSFESPSLDQCWRIPDSLLALQTKVALGISDLDGFADRIRKWRIKPEDFERELA